MLKVMIDYGNALATTGIGTYSRSLLDGLQRFMSDRVSVEEAGVSSFSSTLRPMHRLVYFGKLGILRQSGFRGARIVHFTNNYVPKQRPNVGYAATLYDLDTLYAEEAHSRRFVFYYKKIVRNMIERSHTIVTISETVRTEILEHFRLPESTVKVGGIGISPVFEQLARKTSKSTPAIPTLLFIGQLNKKKNIAWLVQTVERGVRTSALPRMKVVLAGRRGHGFEEIESAMRNAGDIVVWKEGLSTAEIAQLYSECTAVVLPSIREGFGLPLLEAMCSDKPIVASRIPSTVEVTNGGAELFELGNDEEFYAAVLSAIADERSVNRKAIAKQQLEKYSWKNIASEHEKVYRSIADKLPPA